MRVFADKSELWLGLEEMLPVWTLQIQLRLKVVEAAGGKLQLSFQAAGVT